MTDRACIVIADRARARIFTYQGQADGIARDTLVEAADLVDPGRRQTDSETFCETRPGLGHASAGGPARQSHVPQHCVDDHRESHRKEEDRRFAVDLVDTVGEICQTLGSCRLLLLASPQFLGVVRDAFSRRPHVTRNVTEVIEKTRNLTRMSRAQIQDWLAAAALLPARARPGA